MTLCDGKKHDVGHAGLEIISIIMLRIGLEIISFGSGSGVDSKHFAIAFK